MKHSYTICEPEDLRALCIKNNWFTCGSNRQYEKLFALNEDNTILGKEHIDTTAHTKEAMAMLIWACSDSFGFQHIYNKLDEAQKDYYSSLVRYNNPAIRIPTAKEFMDVAEKVPYTSNRFWTKTEGQGALSMTVAWNAPLSIGTEDYPVYQSAGIRPLLSFIENPGVPVWGKFHLGGYEWTMIDDDKALCDEIVKRDCPYDMEAPIDNNSAYTPVPYEKSNVCEWVEDWYFHDVLVQEGMVDKDDFINNIDWER